MENHGSSCGASEMSKDDCAAMMDQKIGCLKQCVPVVDQLLKMFDSMSTPTTKSAGMAQAEKELMDVRAYCELEISACEKALKDISES